MRTTFSAESLARTSPAGLALYTGQGQWQFADHLHLLNGKLMDVAARRVRKLIVSMPPRHGKSTLISGNFPPWWLGQFPDDQVILASYQAGQAAKFGRMSRDTVKEYGRELWGLGIRADKHGASEWLLDGTVDGRRVTGGMKCVGVNTGVTGRGGHLIIIDDPVKDAEQANSELYRNKTWEWYESTLSSRMEPGAVIVVVMTRWHEDDLAGRLIQHGKETGDEWEVINLPAVCEVADGDALGRDVGEALWPGRWPLDELEKKRGETSPYWWNALYQGQPTPPSGNIFKRTWWRFWQPEGVSLPPPAIDVPDDPDYVPIVKTIPDEDSLEIRAQSWDLGFKKGANTSYIVGQLWAGKGTDAFLLDQKRARMSFTETVRAFKAFCAKHPEASAKWVEDKANAQALIDTIQKEIGGLIPVQVDGGDKEARARAVSPFVEAGNVYLPHPAIAPWVHEFIEEMSAFPRAQNDDQVDTTSQALKKLLLGKGGKRVWFR